MSSKNSKNQNLLQDYAKAVEELALHEDGFSSYLMLLSRIAGLCASHPDIRENHFFRKDLESIPVLIEFFGKLTQLYRDSYHKGKEITKKNLVESMKIMAPPKSS